MFINFIRSKNYISICVWNIVKIKIQRDKNKRSIFNILNINFQIFYKSDKVYLKLNKESEIFLSTFIKLN